MNQPNKVEKVVTINKSAEELYRFWHDFENLPRFMKHLKDVKVYDDRRSHWVSRGLLDISIEWDAVIIEDRENELISWASVQGADDKMPMGAAMNKGLTFKMGQTHVHRYLRSLLEHIQNGDIDPSFVITHRLPLDQTSHGYEIFKHKRDNCIKVVLKPSIMDN